MQPTPAGRNASGFSLVELMVALALSLLLIGAILQVYLVNKRSFVKQDQDSIARESGRFALEFMARDIRMAGLFGCGSFSLSDRTLPIRSYLNDTAFPFEIEVGLRGFDATGTGVGGGLTLASVSPSPGGGSWAPALVPGLTGKVLPGSDVLTVTGIESGGWSLVSPFTSGAQIFVETPNDISRGDILLVSDCNQAQIFQASAVGGGGSNVAGAPAALTPGNASPIATRGPVGPFGEGSEVVRVTSVAYYVGQGADGQPALIRESLQTTSASAAGMVRDELVSNIESMQLTYGLDDDGDFQVDRFVGASVLTDWSAVRAVHVGLLVRTPDDVLPVAAAQTYRLNEVDVIAPNDRRQRWPLTINVSIRNRLP
ncbi:MAG: hypothetical protein CVV17_00635 [Gammaproteobacteria bacterium HGW-Gammaproteobacteria-7]|nr:MAG: hypothetical protein CVV17_00635 [Gammaproteobacteria bacterium HGW-Gammaproteobacteria-7]